MRIQILIFLSNKIYKLQALTGLQVKTGVGSLKPKQRRLKNVWGVGRGIQSLLLSVRTDQLQELIK